MNPSKQIALITGGAQGIGKSIVEVLSNAGIGVIVADMNLELAQKTASEYNTPDHPCMAVGLNVTNGDQVTEVIGKTIKEMGRLDILVNNAGITRDGLLIRMKEEDWNLVMDVNVKGAFHCTRAVLQTMTRQRRGCIVNIASIVGVMGNAGQTNYSASKAAIIGFTKSVAREYAARGIRVNAVAPGFIDTAMTQGLPEDARDRLMKQIPLARLGTALDVARAVYFLISEDSNYITGQVLHVNGGMLMV